MPSVTVNKVCLSGINAIAQADQLIRTGEAEVVLAGGMESMSRAPHFLPSARTGVKYGDATLVDSMAYDGLFDQATGQPMGMLTESWQGLDATPRVTREEQDRFATRSHQLAAAAQKNGVFGAEIAPVTLPQRRGEPIVVTDDEGIRADTTFESLSALPPAFAKDGTITAGSASQISDGAEFVVVMARTTAERLGLPWLAEIVAHGQVSGPDSSLQLQPANAIAKALAKARLTADDLALVELNEAFAAVGLESAKALGVDLGRVNVNGGAISIGHPLGASGARITLHLALELQRRGSGFGAAALCGGGGQGDTLVLHAPA